jgi:predicted PurR-regulated permease PerM
MRKPAFLWGMLAAVLNFIPYLGPAIVIATLFVIGLIVFSALNQAVITPLAYVAWHFAEVAPCPR